jgi:hypothetical protein
VTELDTSKESDATLTPWLPCTAREPLLNRSRARAACSSTPIASYHPWDELKPPQP